MRTTSFSAACSSIAAAAILILAGCSSGSDTATGATNPATSGSAGTGLSSAVRTPGTLVVGVNLPNPPLEYQKAGSSEYTGFDVELARAIGTQLGLKVTFTNLAFTALLTSLDSGRVDIVHSALYDTAERQAKYTIVDYLDTGSQIFTTKANASKYPTLESLCGQTIETAVGTAFIDQLKKLSTTLCAGKSPLKVLTVGGSFAEEVLAVTTGRAAAAITTTDNIAYSLSLERGKYVRIGAPFNKVAYGIDIPKSNTVLATAIRSALSTLMRNGKYTSIVRQFGLQAGARTTVTVNTGT